MIDQQTVYDTCTQLAADGPVSFRRLYATVGGNRENVRQWWHQWRREAGEDDEPLLAEAVTETVEQFLETHLWKAHRRELQTVIPALTAEKAQLVAEIQALREERAQLHAENQVLRQDNATLRQERVDHRRALLAFVSGEDDGTTS